MTVYDLVQPTQLYLLFGQVVVQLKKVIKNVLTIFKKTQVNMTNEL